MRRRTLTAFAAVAALAVPATAVAHGNDNRHAGWNTKKWDARALLAPTAAGEDAAGRAFLKQRPGTVTIALRVGKLDPNGRFAARIQQGACDANGASALALPDLYADERGVARLWITLPTPAGMNLATTGYSVNVLGYDAAGAVAAGITCGAIDAPSGRAAAKVRPSVDNGTVKGSVLAKQDGGLLRVEIHLKGLVPASAHAQHIHVGSCQNQGGIVVPFPDAVADADGEYHSIQTVAAAGVNVVNGGYYYNIHVSPTPTVGAGIACGDLRSRGHRGHGPWWFAPGWWGL